MNIIEYIKASDIEQPIDKYIIYLLYFGLSKAEVMRRINVSRPTVLKAIERSKALMLKNGLLDTSDKV